VNLLENTIFHGKISMTIAFPNQNKRNARTFWAGQSFMFSDDAEYSPVRLYRRISDLICTQYKKTGSTTDYTDYIIDSLRFSGFAVAFA
jgi:hypothetical protein